MIGLVHYLTLSAVLFAIGLYGALAKRNVITVLLCIEIMLSAVNITLVAFSRFITPVELTGQVFVVFTMIVAAAEVAVALAIIMSVYKHRGTVDSTEINLMKW